MPLIPALKKQRNEGQEFKVRELTSPPSPTKTTTPKTKEFIVKYKLMPPI